MRFDNSVSLVADEGLVWRRAADVERMPLYWPSIRSLQVKRTDGGLKYAAVGYADDKTGSVTIFANEDEKTLLLYYTEGPVVGTQRISVAREKLRVVWNVRFEGLNFFAAAFAGSRLKEETKEALEKLARSYEA